VSNAARSRMLGRLLMVVAVLQMLAFVVGLARRSYLVVALPVGGGLAALSALAFWVGYTMAYAQWDDDEDAAAAVPVEHPEPLEPLEAHAPSEPSERSEPPEGSGPNAPPEAEPAPF